MKKLVAAFLLSSVAFALPAAAQDAPRSYDNGPVWVVTSIQTKPGHFDDYMHFLDTQWKAEQEDSKKQGWVLDYKVLASADPRDNEPDLFLMVEYKNIAVMDTSLDVLDAQAKRLSGSLTAANKASVSRESIRTEKGDVLTRELILK